MQSVFNNLINGNLTDAKNGAKSYRGTQLQQYAQTELGWTERRSHLAARYLKFPSQATYDAYCNADQQPPADK